MEQRPVSDDYENAAAARERAGKNSGGEDFAARILPIGLIFGIGVLIATEVPLVSTTIRAGLAIVGTALLLVLWAMCRQYAEPLASALRHRVPNLFVLLLFLWSVVAFFLSPYRNYATLELLRLLSGFAIYSLAGFALLRRNQPFQVAAGLLSVGCAIALYDFLRFSQMQGGLTTVSEEYSLIGNHENIATLLVLLLPLALAYALAPVNEARARIPALCMTLLLGAALLLARTRTAWVAGLFAIALLGFLLIRWQMQTFSAPQRRTGRTKLAALLGTPIIPVLLAFSVLVTLGGVLPLVTKRTATFNTILEDGSVQDRLLRWRAAARMTAERPVAGWGLGAWTVAQGRWTHAGHEASVVLTQGTDHRNIAHNYYMQWASETGGVGVALYVATLVGFLLNALQCQSRLSPANRTLLLGCAGTVAAALVDGIGSPGYNMAGEYGTLWLALGLGVAAMRDDGRTPAAKAPTPLWVWAGGLVTGIVVAVGILTWGFSQKMRGAEQPRGSLLLVATPAANRVAPGTLVRLEARFRDSNGQELTTFPGTQWNFQTVTPRSLQDTESRLIAVYGVGGSVRSAFQVRMTTTVKPITVTVSYMDEYGREYTALSVVSIAVPARRK